LWKEVEGLFRMLECIILMGFFFVYPFLFGLP